MFFSVLLGELFGVSVLDAPQNYQFGETTFPGYAMRSQTSFYFATQKGPFRTLNVDRLLFSPLRGLTVVGRSAVLNGILQSPTLNATSLTLPKLIVLLLQMGNLDTDTPKSSVQREK